MTTKFSFVKKIKKILPEYMNENASNMAISEMIRLKLPMIKDNELIPDRYLDECISIIYARIVILKGHIFADKFLENIESWRLRL